MNDTSRLLSGEAQINLAENQKLKVETLLDLIRRATVNPQNIRRVAETIAIDWYPVLTVTAKGDVEIILPNKDEKIS